MNELITIFLLISIAVKSRRTEWMNLLVVRIVVARTVRDGAMAMAMALKGGRDIGTVTGSFTPLHTTRLGMAIYILGLVVWGRTPPEADGT